MMKNFMTGAKVFGLMTVLTGVFLGVGAVLGGRGGMVIALGAAAVMNIGSYWFSHKIVLKMHRAEKMNTQEYGWLESSLEDICSEAGIPEPELYVSPMPVPNAFATGRNPDKGVVCLTEPLLRKLERDEIKGVVAHEVAHIKNRDTLTNSVVATLAGGIAMLADFAFWGALFSGREENGEIASAAVAMIITPIIATLIKSAISRSMEYRADRDAVSFVEEKQPFMSALKKIDSESKTRGISASRSSEASANMFIVNPFTKHSLTKYFSTHPPTEKRIEAIRKA
jgi:heat shock protein HtpX